MNTLVKRDPTQRNIIVFPVARKAQPRRRPMARRKSMAVRRVKAPTPSDVQMTIGILAGALGASFFLLLAYYLVLLLGGHS